MKNSLYFWPCFLLLAIAYLCLEISYANRLPLAMEEFQFLKQLYIMSEKIPYRDYKPYKNVIGQYLQLPFIFLTANEYKAAILIRIFSAFVVVATMVLFANKIQNKISNPAILAGIVLLFFNATFLERTVEVRVDLLTALFSLIAFLFIIQSRYLISGAFLGFAFLISQKALLYFPAMFIVAVMHCLDDKSGQTFKKIKLLLLAICIPVIPYLAIAIYFAGFQKMLDYVFIQHLDKYFGETNYELGKYWIQLFDKDPHLYILTAIGIIASITHRLFTSSHFSSDFRTVGLYVITLIVTMMFYHETWPYFFVLLIPFLCVFSMFYFEFFLRTLDKVPRAAKLLLIFAVIFIGCGRSLTNRVPRVFTFSQTPQKLHISVGKKILQPTDTYFAGTPILVRVPQNPADLSLEWWDSNAMQSWKTHREDQRQEVYRKLESDPPAFVLENYKIKLLPPRIRDFFYSKYSSYFGKIYTYSIKVPQGEGNIIAESTGFYCLGKGSFQDISVSGKSLLENKSIYLTRGEHRYTAANSGLIQRCAVGVDIAKLEPIAQGQFFSWIFSE